MVASVAWDVCMNCLAADPEVAQLYQQHINCALLPFHFHARHQLSVFKKTKYLWILFMKEWKGQLPFTTLCSWASNSHVHFSHSAQSCDFSLPAVIRSLSPVFWYKNLYPFLGDFSVSWLGFWYFLRGKGGFLSWSWGVLRALCIPIWASWLWLVKRFWDLELCSGLSIPTKVLPLEKWKKAGAMSKQSRGSYFPNVFPKYFFPNLDSGLGGKKKGRKEGFYWRKEGWTPKFHTSTPVSAGICGWTGEVGVWDEHQSSW